MSADISAPRFHDPVAARKFLEELRWPDGPVCPHCGSVNKAYKNKSKPTVYRCGEPECRKDFSVKVGTLFERSHIPLHKWLLASHLLMAGKKGISAHQLHRMLGVSYKTAWFMAHRIREARREPSFSGSLGGQNKVVECVANGGFPRRGDFYLMAQLTKALEPARHRARRPHSEQVPKTPFET